MNLSSLIVSKNPYSFSISTDLSTLVRLPYTKMLPFEQITSEFVTAMSFDLRGSARKVCGSCYLNTNREISVPLGIGIKSIL